jgi:outer membrane protein TolC
VEVADAQYRGARAQRDAAAPSFELVSPRVRERARPGRWLGVQSAEHLHRKSQFLADALPGGRLVASTKAADRTRNASRFDEHETRAQVTLQVERAYVNALYTDRITQLQRRNLALASARLTQVEQFEKAGRAARYDVLRARVERANIEPLALQAQKRSRSRTRLSSSAC